MVFPPAPTSLPNGPYDWWFKGAKWLATSGTLTLPATNQEFGTQTAGDANDNNTVDGQDFVILKTTFDKAVGDPGYDPRADFNNDDICNLADFNLLKRTFGLAGAPLICASRR